MPPPRGGHTCAPLLESSPLAGCHPENLKTGYLFLQQIACSARFTVKHVWSTPRSTARPGVWRSLLFDGVIKVSAIPLAVVNALL